MNVLLGHLREQWGVNNIAVALKPHAYRLVKAGRFPSLDNMSGSDFMIMVTITHFSFIRL